MENLPSFFKRRFDHHRFEKTMRRTIGYVIHLSKSFDDFESRLFSLALVNYFQDRHNIDMSIVSNEDLNDILIYLSDIYEPLVREYYKNAKRR